MFGHDDNSTKNDTDQADAPHIGTVTSDNPPLSDAPNSTWQHPGAPLDTGDTPAGSAPQTPPPGAPSHTASISPLSTTTDDVSAVDDLVEIKRQALTQLSPLVGHLDQTPEEKFRTTMMMIQASDDQSLISSAYEAAGKITDEKARAQALLDIVNEINYFTQQAADKKSQ